MLTKFICCIIIQNSRIFIFQQTKNIEGFKAITIDAPEGSGSTYATQPWLVLKYAYENNILSSYYHAGMIRCGSRFAYSGYLIESKMYGSWIIHGYSGEIIHVVYTNGTWKYAKTTSNFVEF